MLLCFVLSLVAAEQQEWCAEFCGKIVLVEPSLFQPKQPGRTWLSQTTTNCPLSSSLVVVPDPQLMRQLNDLSWALSTLVNITALKQQPEHVVCARNVTFHSTSTTTEVVSFTETRVRDSNKGQYVWYPVGSIMWNLHNNPCPKPDFFNRYITLPVSYSRPELGTFKLLYQLDKNFVPGQEMWFVPSSGETQFSVADGGIDNQRAKYAAKWNLVLIEPRGLPCSALGFTDEDGGVDWEKVYWAADTANAVEDVFRVFVDLREAGLLGPSGKWTTAGGSGDAILPLEVMAVHPDVFQSALLISVASPEFVTNTGIHFVDPWIDSHPGLRADFETVLKNPRIARTEFLDLVWNFMVTTPSMVPPLVREMAVTGTSSVFENYAWRAPMDTFEDLMATEKPWLGLYTFQLGAVPLTPPRLIDLNDRSTSSGCHCHSGTLHNRDASQRDM